MLVSFNCFLSITEACLAPVVNFPARNNKTLDLLFRAIPCEYEGRPLNCGTEVLQGAL